jgi:hypothetical protein
VCGTYGASAFLPRLRVRPAKEFNLNIWTLDETIFAALKARPDKALGVARSATPRKKSANNFSFSQALKVRPIL